MTNAYELFDRYFGVIRRQTLLHHGFTDAQISRGLRDGRLKRIRNGWFVLSNSPPKPEVAAAVQARGALTGPHALALRGAWDLRWPRPTYRAARLDASARRREMISLRRFDERYVPVKEAVDPLDLAFEASLAILPPRELICVADSLVHRRLMSRDELEAIASRHGLGTREVVERVNGIAESGTETYVRLWLERQGIVFHQQVPMPLIRGRVDFLIGNRLVLEVDSIAHHTDWVDRQRDYDRDQALKAAGYRVFRVSYIDVMHRWDAVSQHLLALIRRDEHRRLPKGLS